MSGRKINDMGGYPHSSDMAMKSKNRVMHETSAEGAGEVTQYEDTTQRIKATQEMGRGKAKSHPLKSGYRY